MKRVKNRLLQALGILIAECGNNNALMMNFKAKVFNLALMSPLSYVHKDVVTSKYSAKDAVGLLKSLLLRGGAQRVCRAIRHWNKY